MPKEGDKKQYQIEPGSIIAGKYEVEREIGRGGMGRIVAARHQQLEERVALKFLMAPEDRAEEFNARFLREAQVTAKLRGAHVARTLDFGVTDHGDPFIVMEYLDGINLRELLRESGPLPIDVAVDYAMQACTGLAEAHRLHVVHRDLKPANLFLTKHLDGGDLVKILDFGVSKLRSFTAAKSDLTAAGTMLGSPKYMAIEQLNQAAEVDERADIWSLGAILYHMLVGHPPFDGKNTASVCMAIMSGQDPPSMCEKRPEIPAALDRAVLRCLSRNLDARTPNVAVLAREMAEGSGIEGLEAMAQAVEDVLVQPKSLGSTGQIRSFGKTGAFASATGRHRAAGASDDSGSSKGASRGAGSQDDTGPSGAVASAPPGDKGRRALLLVAVGVVFVGGASAFALSGEDPPSVAPEPSSLVAPTASPVPEVAPAVDAASSSPVAGDAAPDGPADAAPEAAKPPPPVRVVGRPPPPRTTAASPATTAAPPATKKPEDTFGSRY
jgi:serine/threonine-protein kinase